MVLHCRLEKGIAGLVTWFLPLKTARFLGVSWRVGSACAIPILTTRCMLSKHLARAPVQLCYFKHLEHGREAMVMVIIGNLT